MEKYKGGNMRLENGRLALVAALVGSVLGILNISVPAQAQSLPMSVNIPFDFHVGERVLPAGTYIVLRQGEAIQLSDKKGHSAFVLSNAVANKAAKLDNQIVFNNYGSDYFLTEVRWNGYLSARALPKSSTETRLAKDLNTQRILTAGLTE
jgi:hypothetical protein